MASEFEYTPTPEQGVTLGTHDASEYASSARDQAQQQQQAAPSGGSPSGGGRQQRPVTMNQNTVGAVTSDGQVIQNPGYTPDAKRQDAFDNYARAGMRKNAEASRQQYYDTIRANESLQNDQFKRGVDEVNQRGFNLYGVLDNIDKAGGKNLSPEQGRMLEAATTDFGKQVAKNYGWQFNGAEYDWDKGTFTFQFQNDKGQIGTKTMSRDALNAQMIKAGYVDDPVEVRKREMAEEAERQKTDLATAKFAADLGFKQDELNQKIAAADKEHIVKLIDVASKLRGEDGQLDDFGRAILTYAINGLTGGQNAQTGQQGAAQQGGEQPYSGAAAAFANAPGSTVSTNSEYAQRGRELNDARKAQDAKIKAEKDAKSAGQETAAQESASQTSSRVSKFGGGVSEMSAEDKETARDLADLRRQKNNGTLTPGARARLDELDGMEISDEQRAAMKKAGYGDEARDERHRVARDMTRKNMGVEGETGSSGESSGGGESGRPRKGGAVEALVNKLKAKQASGATLNEEELKTLSKYGGEGSQEEQTPQRDEAAEEAAYNARGEEYRKQLSDGPNDEQKRLMDQETGRNAVQNARSRRAEIERAESEKEAGRAATSEARRLRSEKEKAEVADIENTRADIAENYSKVLSDAGLLNEDLTDDDVRAIMKVMPGNAEKEGKAAVEDYLYDIGAKFEERNEAFDADKRKKAAEGAEKKRAAFERKLRMDEANEAAARANRTMGASTFGGTVYDTVKDVGYGLRKSGKAIAGAAAGAARAIHNAGERAGEEIYTWREAAEDAKKEREERRAKRKNRKGN